MAYEGKASFGATTVSTSASAIGAPLGNRTNIVIYNNDPSVTLYVGVGDGAASVTTSTGYPILPQTSLSLDVGPQLLIYGIAASSISVRFMEAY